MAERKISAGMGDGVVKLTIEDLPGVLAAHREWVESGGRAGKRANLRGAYLGGADLRGADLRGAYLRGADLGGADLGGAYGVAWVGPVGSAGRQVIAVDHGDKVMVHAGCWWGSVDDLRERIAPGGDHGWDAEHEARYRAEYEAAITYLVTTIERRRS